MPISKDPFSKLDFETRKRWLELAQELGWSEEKLRSHYNNLLSIQKQSEERGQDFSVDEIDDLSVCSKNIDLGIHFFKGNYSSQEFSEGVNISLSESFRSEIPQNKESLIEKEINSEEPELIDKISFDHHLNQDRKEFISTQDEENVAPYQTLKEPQDLRRNYTLITSFIILFLAVLVILDKDSVKAFLSNFQIKTEISVVTDESDELGRHSSGDPILSNDVEESQNVKRPISQELYEDPELNRLIKDALTLIDPALHQDISISIIDLSRGSNCCAYGGYQDNISRYPASIVKLFWIVMLYSMDESGLLSDESSISLEDEAEAIHESDNDAAAKILDVITGSKSSFDYFLSDEEFIKWLSERTRVNDYFETVGYGDLNVSQKTFPLQGSNVFEPKGTDLQIRAYNLDGSLASKPPVRNYLNTSQVAKLLLELSAGSNLLSEEASSHIKSLLQHDLSEDSWTNASYLGVEGFFGEYLPDGVKIYTKIGYTKSYGRQEGAIIESENGSAKYILVMFANNSFFSKPDSKYFPNVSQLIYEHMSSR